MELCKNRLGNDQYANRMMQTLNGAPKTKEVQCDKIVMADKGKLVGIFFNRSLTFYRKIYRFNFGSNHGIFFLSFLCKYINKKIVWSLCNFFFSFSRNNEYCL